MARMRQDTDLSDEPYFTVRYNRSTIRLSNARPLPSMLMEIDSFNNRPVKSLLVNCDP